MGSYLLLVGWLKRLMTMDKEIASKLLLLYEIPPDIIRADIETASGHYIRIDRMKDNTLKAYGAYKWDEGTVRSSRTEKTS